MKRKVLKKQKKNSGTAMVETNKEEEKVMEAADEGITMEDEEVEETFVEKNYEDDEIVGVASTEHAVEEEEKVGEIIDQGTTVEDEKVSEEHNGEHAENEEEFGWDSGEDEKGGEFIVEESRLEDEKVSEEHYEEHTEDEEEFGGASDKELDNEAEKLVENSAVAAAAAIVGDSIEQKSPETTAVKPRLMGLIKGINVDATSTVHGTDEKKNEYVLSGNIEEVDDMELNMTREINKDNYVGGDTSVGGMNDTVKVAEVSAEAAKNAALSEKNTPKKLKAKGKISKPRAKQVVKTNIVVGTLQIKETNDEKGNLFVANAQEKGESSQKKKDTEVSKGQREESPNGDEKNKYQLTEEKTGQPENGNHNSRKRGRYENKKFKKELSAKEIAQQKEPGGMEKINTTNEKGDNLQDGGETEKKKVKLGGLIFMCNAKTKPDCLRYSVMGVKEINKDQVLGIRPGLKLFLYDYELKLLYGVFQASSSGGMMLERKAFGGSFPVQVRFKVLVDCNPLPESAFKKVIKEIYISKKKFKTELTPAQVSKLRRLFKRAPVRSNPRFPPRPHLAPASRNVNRGRSEKKRYAPSSSSRGIQIHNEDRAPRRVSPLPPRREEPRDLYLSEREYRVHGLRREEGSRRHYDIPISDPYARDSDRVHRLPRHPEVVYERREAVRNEPLYMPARDLRPYDVPARDLRPYDVGVIREIPPPALVPKNRYASDVGLEPYAREPQDPYGPTVGSETYARDRHPTYRYGSMSHSERPESAYLASAARRDDDELYSRYATADSLADYYQTRRYRVEPRTAELAPQSGSSAYPYGGLSYSYR